MTKINFIFDKTKNSLTYKKKVLKSHINYSAKKSDCFVVAGGDGFMLQTIKKNYKYNKPFYGVNCGTYGFLMNKYQFKNLESKIKKSKQIIINPIKILATSYKNKKINLIAINEASLFRQSRQTASIQIIENKKMILKKLIGDGILISTPAGSTAYNYSANGPILTLRSGKLAVTPISPFRPRKWKGKIVSNKSVIKIKNLNPKKRPLALVADNIEKRNIKSLEIKNYKKINIILLYDKSTNLNNKIKSEQKRKKY
jgi:NAD+ kinase